MTAIVGALIGVAVAVGGVVAVCGIESVFIVGDFFSLILAFLAALFGLGLGALMGAGVGYVAD
jgi:hypothetical protein